MNHLSQPGNVIGAEQAIHEHNKRNSPQTKLGNLGGRRSQHDGHDLAERNAPDTPGDSNTHHMKKLPQKGHDYLLGIGRPLGRFGTRGGGLCGLHRKLTAILDFLGVLLAVCDLNDGQYLRRPRARICAHCFGIDLDIDIVAILDQGLKLYGHIGIVGSTTLIGLLDHQHY